MVANLQRFQCLFILEIIKSGESFTHPVPNMDLIYDTYARRISFLDSQWKIA